MFLQRAAAALLKRVRLTPKPFCASRGPATNDFPTSLPSKLKFYNENGSRGYTWRVDHLDLRLWILISGQAIILGLNSNPVLAEGMPIDSNPENDMEGASITGLRKVEDGSVVSNIHTSKWRVFTDNGRDFFLQGKLKEAEKFFHSALQEAKEGFGERDPHVASACNNLAELYRVKKAFDKAEPLYLEAINILEESFGPEDIRLGAAYHNLGQFYLVQRKLEEARVCYERALKIKQRVLGHAHTDYADTMYHLGTVLYLQGKERDAEALIQDSIRILEDADQGESITCIRRLRYLSQIYLKSNCPAEAENIQRKILHIMELSKGWESLDTVNAAEALALTLQSTGNLKEAQEFLERCLDARKTLLPEDHVQVAGNMLHLARVSMLSSNMLRKMHIAEALKELDKAKDLLLNSARIAQNVLNKLIKHRGCNQNAGAFGETQRNGHAAFVILLQSLDALALLETTRRELLDSKEGDSAMHGAENALFRCISAYREFGSERLLVDSPEVKSEYLSCLKHFATLIADITAEGKEPFSGTTLPGLKDEIKRIEAEISSYRRSKHRASS